MVTNETVTVESVVKELADLETMYKARRKKLRALLAVLWDEVVPAEEDKPDAE